MRFNKWIGVAICVILIAACYMPWTFHADVQKNFNGFFSEKDAYGKPGKTFIFLAVISIILILAQRLWAKRTLLFVSAVLVAYAIKTYTLYTSCYNAYCPEKKYGIFVVIACSLLIFMVALFPDMKLVNKNETIEKETSADLLK